MKLFNFFAFSKAKRKNQEEPKDRTTWIKHGISELVGTFLLSMALAGLSTIVANTDKAVEYYFVEPFIVGFYAGMIAVGAVLFIFLRWSCDLNPAVTITRMINGTNTYRYGFYKIFIQFIGGIIAGLVIYALGKMGNGAEWKQGGNNVLNPDAANHAISALGASGKTFYHSHLNLGTKSIADGALWIFFIEMIMMSALLFTVFSKVINSKYRDFAIMFIISMIVWMGVLSGTAAINPARGLAQQVPALFFGHEVGNLGSNADMYAATFAMLAGTLFAPFFYIFSQGVLEYYLNPMIVAIIGYKNNRAENMTKK